MRYDETILKEAIEIAHDIFWVADEPEVLRRVTDWIKHFPTSKIADRKLLAKYVAIVAYEAVKYAKEV